MKLLITIAVEGVRLSEYVDDWDEDESVEKIIAEERVADEVERALAVQLRHQCIAWDATAITWSVEESEPEER
jgi:hypothetical protein